MFRTPLMCCSDSRRGGKYEGKTAQLTRGDCQRSLERDAECGASVDSTILLWRRVGGGWRAQLMSDFYRELVDYEMAITKQDFKSWSLWNKSTSNIPPNFSDTGGDPSRTVVDISSPGTYIDGVTSILVTATFSINKRTKEKKRRSPPKVNSPSTSSTPHSS